MSQRITVAASTTSLTCGTTLGSTTVTSSAAFASVTVGMRLYGAGITIGSVVTVVTDTSTITISLPATATSASVSLQFDYFTSAAYTAGDCLGFPLLISVDKANQLHIIDTDKVLGTGGVTGYFFESAIAVTADNAAFSPSAADCKKIIGYFTTTTNIVLGNAHYLRTPLTDLPVYLSKTKTPVYLQLIAIGTPTFTHAGSISIFISDTATSD